MTGILIAAAIVGGVGLFIGVFLGVAEKQFAATGAPPTGQALTGASPLTIAAASPEHPA